MNFNDDVSTYLDLNFDEISTLVCITLRLGLDSRIDVGPLRLIIFEFFSFLCNM